MSEAEQPNFRVLKIVVGVLGIAIVAMTAIIIVTAINRFGGMGEDAAEATPPPAAAAPRAESATPWRRTLDGSVADASLDDGLLMLVLEAEDGTRRIEVLDPRTGALIGRAAPE
jgi:hypothetical protein